jgi:hypothetical protein
MRTLNRFLFLAPLFILVTAASAADLTQMVIFSRNVDPCTVASVAQLKPIMTSALNSAFPLVKESPGKRVTLSNPELVDLKCAPLKVEVRAKIQTRDTRGLDQGQASGQVRFSAKIGGKVSYVGGPAAPITKSNFKGAKACIGDVTVLGLNLNNVPNWLDNTVIKDFLNNNLSKTQFCQDITPYVSLYLQNGGTL